PGAGNHERRDGRVAKARRLVTATHATDDGASIGLLEVGSWTAAIAAIDAAEKAAPVRVVQVELNDMLGASVKLAGDTADVAAALEAAEATAAAMQAAVVTATLNRPEHEVARLWPLKAEFNPLIEQDVVHV